MRHIPGLSDNKRQLHRSRSSTMAAPTLTVRSVKIKWAILLIRLP